MSTEALKVAHDLDAAIAAYQRYHGRLSTIDKLRHALESREAAQKVMDDAMARVGSPRPRAAE